MPMSLSTFHARSTIRFLFYDNLFLRGEISAFGGNCASVYCANLRDVLACWCVSFELTVISDVERRESK